MFSNKFQSLPTAGGGASQSQPKRIYSSFAETKGGHISQSRRLLWNDTSCPVPPSKYFPIGPSPVSYYPALPLPYRGVPIPKSKRVSISVPRLTTPGPGYYSSADLNSPFTSFGDANSGCKSVPPKKSGWSISKCSSPRPFPIDVSGPPVFSPGSPQSKGSTANRGTFKGFSTTASSTASPGLISPHPQMYRPNYKSIIEENKLGGLTFKSPRFPLKAIVQSPGPGDYGNVDKPRSEAFCKVRLYRRNRRLDQMVADHRNLLRESKNPGPGSYDPQLLHNGRDFQPFDHPGTRSYYVLCTTTPVATTAASTHSSIGMNGAPNNHDDESFSNLHHYGVSVVG
jgi:hypothetical protein